ncbi:MAG: hypothetical protein JWP10_187 [Nocardioidaceae bacterium]|nr:hypothetical protein [Nocardioidaceae bacterium]
MQARRERGMVTAETAVVLPFLVAIGLLLVWVVSIGMTQVRLVDASREGARMIARGDATSRAVRTVKDLAPKGAKVSVSKEDGLVTITVKGTAKLDIPLFARVTKVGLKARSVSSLEGNP